ncbi:ankyrin repeat-containing domain protein [Irpex lacteus]|nr:ankyrin repeat-containing domain protein [Irpex lacteus]
MDALEDLLSRLYGHSDEDVSHLLKSLEAAEYTVARSSLLKAIRFTPLQYAIMMLSPSSVESLLAEGADVKAEPTLAYAARCARDELIELLIDKGADVNMKDRKGRTALHWACHYGNYNLFFELVRCAEDEIDWDARTLEGENAFELGVSEGMTSLWASCDVDEFRLDSSGLQTRPLCVDTGRNTSVPHSLCHLKHRATRTALDVDVDVCVRVKHEFDVSTLPQTADEIRLACALYAAVPVSITSLLEPCQLAQPMQRRRTVLYYF